LPRSEIASAVLRRSRLAQLGFFIVAFAIATLVARAFGAGWGTASTFGQIAFVAAVVVVLMIDERPGGG
jgi:cation transporter-like permease